MLQFFPALVLLFWQAQFAQADVRGLPLATQLLFCAQTEGRPTAPDCLISVLIHKRDTNQSESCSVPVALSQNTNSDEITDSAHPAPVSIAEFLIVRPSDRMRDGPASA